MISKHYVGEIEEDSDDQNFKSKEGDPETGDIRENIHDMTDSYIYYIENARGNKSKLEILGLQFQTLLPTVAEEFAKLDALSVFANLVPSTITRHHYLCAFNFAYLTCVLNLHVLRNLGALLMHLTCITYALYLCIFRCDRISYYLL